MAFARSAPLPFPSPPPTISPLPSIPFQSDFLETLATLRRMADRLQCDLSVVYEKVVQENPLLKCAEVEPPPPFPQPLCECLFRMLFT